MDKKAILREIRALLEKERRINFHHHPIRLSFSNDDLVLEGEAENIAAKKLALEIAGAMPGIGNIVDRLRVAPAQRMGDAETCDRVCTALVQEPALDACTIRARRKDTVQTFRKSDRDQNAEIEVEVEDGVVLLNGQVPSIAHKRLAGALAWWVPGSRDVINGLEESPAEQDNDDEVTDAVRLVLEKDPFVPADQIRVTTRNYVVNLEGVVLNRAIKQMAEFDAWYVFGVNRVINRLLVEHGGS